MKKVMYRWFFVWNYDAEEKWLNEMSAHGWQLESTQGFRYTFIRGEPNAYCYRLEMLENVPGHEQSREYLDFLTETGVEVVGKWLRWVYLRKKNDGSIFELFSEIDSRIQHLQRMRTLLVVLVCVVLMAGINNLMLGIGKGGAMAVAICLGALCIALGVILLSGIVKLWRKINALQAERRLHE